MLLTVYKQRQYFLFSTRKRQIFIHTIRIKKIHCLSAGTNESLHLPKMNVSFTILAMKRCLMNCWSYQKINFIVCFLFHGKNGITKQNCPVNGRMETLQAIILFQPKKEPI